MLARPRYLAGARAKTVTLHLAVVADATGGRAVVPGHDALAWAWATAETALPMALYPSMQAVLRAAAERAAELIVISSPAPHLTTGTSSSSSSSSGGGGAGAMKGSGAESGRAQGRRPFAHGTSVPYKPPCEVTRTHVCVCMRVRSYVFVSAKVSLCVCVTRVRALYYVDVAC
jgi:hypothetical protein